MKEHRWSGWPGAYCMNCGIADPAETCIAVHDALDYVCRICREHWPQGDCIVLGGHDVETVKCPEHKVGPCPIP